LLDDLLGQVFGEVVFGRLSRSRRAQLLFRFFFGFLGAGLCFVGAAYFAVQPDLTTNLALRFSMIGLFVFFGCFWLLNVALGRTWRWPGLLTIASFVAMFVTRIALGP
jgi:hypothetical protein